MPFHVTYEIVTPESAEHGEAAERGFVLPGNWRTELPESVCGEAAGKVKDECALSLREAFKLFGTGAIEDSGRWFTECDGTTDFVTGADERRSFHPPENTTPASYKRLRRLLRAA